MLRHLGTVVLTFWMIIMVIMSVTFGWFQVFLIYSIPSHLIGNEMSDIDALVSCVLATKNLWQLIVEH